MELQRKVIALSSSGRSPGNTMCYHFASGSGWPSAAAGEKVIAVYIKTPIIVYSFIVITEFITHIMTLENYKELLKVLNMTRKPQDLIKIYMKDKNVIQGPILQVINGASNLENNGDIVSIGADRPSKLKIKSLNNSNPEYDNIEIDIHIDNMISVEYIGFD